MTDDEVNLLKQALDAQLAGTDPKNGVKFGSTAFKEFAKRGWITMEDFSAFGTGAFTIPLPAYDRTRFAHVDPFVDDESVVMVP